MISSVGLYAMAHAVSTPTRTTNPEKSTVLQRKTLTFSSSVTGPRFSRRGRTKSRAKLVPRALSAVLSEPIAVAMTPAMTSPRMPAGISVMMKYGNASRETMSPGRVPLPDL